MGSHSLGVTQSLMYAFSRACMVFTTANSSAMLSYLRSVSVRPWLPRLQGAGVAKLHIWPGQTHILLILGVGWGLGWGHGGVCGEHADSLLPLPGILVQLHFLLGRGALRQHRGGCSHGHLLSVSASQVGTCHSPHTAPACFQELQQSRQKAGSLATKAAAHPPWSQPYFSTPPRGRGCALSQRARRELEDRNSMFGGGRG